MPALELKGVVDVNPAESPAVRLAQRLRALRTDGFAGRELTQGELAKALGASGPLISSWESTTKPKSPPRERLEAYATFFATERSLDQTPLRVLSQSQLTSEELARRDELLQELLGLRGRAQGNEPGVAVTDPFDGSLWRFPANEDITIVCSELPEHIRESIPYTDPKVPDHVRLYKYADLDALLELFGHLRAVNPLSTIRYRTPTELNKDDYTSHLVLLGGVDRNATTVELLRRLDMPVRQLPRASDAEAGGFSVLDQEGQWLFEPVLRKEHDDEILVEDVAHFLRAPNPISNGRRTVTICNGMYARGTLGAVRALTDPRFRDRNENYLRTRFADSHTFSILSRVKVFLGEVVTPDWTSSDDLLHEWRVPRM